MQGGAIMCVCGGGGCDEYAVGTPLLLEWGLPWGVEHVQTEGSGYCWPYCLFQLFFQALFRGVWGLGSPATASNLPVCWSPSQQQQFLVGSATYFFPWLLSQHLLGFVSP